jgi:hypothetical protein
MSKVIPHPKADDPTAIWSSLGRLSLTSMTNFPPRPTGE